METSILLVMLATSLVLSITARAAADAIMHHHYEQKADFFRHYPTQPGDIVFLGDSITDGADWDEIFPGLPVRNRGINADTTTGVLARLPEIVAGRPAAVFLLIGTNDLAWIAFRGNDAILSTYAMILEKLRAGSPATKIYVQSILPRARRFAPRIRLLNAQLEQLALRFGCTYIDLFPLFATPEGAIRPELTNDQLHLMGPAYKIWAEAVRPYLPA